MLHFHPRPSAPAPPAIARARKTIEAHSWHPDAEAALEALGIIAEAMERLERLASWISLRDARDALSCERYGMLGVLADAASDLGAAFRRYDDDPFNHPDAAAHAAAVDLRALVEKEEF